MRCWPGALVGCVSLAALSGCGQNTPDPNAAVLEELRQLRQAVAPQPIDARALAQALEPLHERLRSLDRAQADSAQRQALADELARWTMVLAMNGRALPPGWPPAGGAPTGGDRGGNPLANDPRPPTAPAPAASPQEPQPQRIDPALLQRIADLERKLAAGEQHQDELDALVARSLDGTTAHVDRILAELQAVVARGDLPRASAGPDAGGSASPPPQQSAPAPVERTAPEPAAGVPAAALDAAADPAPRLAADAAAREEAFLRARSDLRQLWLIGILAFGLCAIGWIAWRLRPRSAAPQSTAPAEPRGDMTTDELWAAAGLLSEAVGRLRSAVPPTPAADPASAAEAASSPAAMAAEPTAPASPEGPVAIEPEPAAPTLATRSAQVDPLQDIDLGNGVGDDVFVLDDERNLLADVDWTRIGGDDVAPRPAVAAADAENITPTNGHGEAPPRWTILLAAKDHVLARATVDAYLLHDPRVLRQPAPVVRAAGDGLEVQVALLPGLLAGEREHLRATLQRLLQQT